VERLQWFAEIILGSEQALLVPRSGRQFLQDRQSAGKAPLLGMGRYRLDSPSAETVKRIRPKLLIQCSSLRACPTISWIRPTTRSGSSI